MKTYLKLTSKILVSDTDISRVLAYYRFRDFKIVFTNGCFDILHRGHVDYLAKAADLGDILIIGLNTDDSVKRLKGENRPIFDQDSRAIMLAALSFVNNIIFFEEDTPIELIEIVKPDILVKGADYNEQNIVGADFVKQYGGSVKTIELTPGFSTTNIISKLK
ncbi:MAG: hypothetical protein Kow0068_09920 [Marinilabiliales bacterium]